MSNSTRFVCLTAILGLSACGGGGGGGDNSGGSSSRSYASLVAQHQEFVRDHSKDGVNFYDVTPVEAMPRSGSATYEGPALLTTNARELQLAGSAQVVADFKGGTVNGTVSDFKAAPGFTTTGGNVNINGVIQGNNVAGTVDGRVNVNGVNHGLDGEMDGTFLENDADSLFIGAAGTTDKGADFKMSVTTEKD